jgi:hypothetical protein
LRLRASHRFAAARRLARHVTLRPRPFLYGRSLRSGRLAGLIAKLIRAVFYDKCQSSAMLAKASMGNYARASVVCTHPFPEGNYFVRKCCVARVQGLRRVVAGVALGCLASAAGVAAESAAVLHAYAEGVHAYFAGDYPRSYDALSMSIDGGSRDARARYFRGLAALRLGRLHEAEADFSEGSRLESRAGVREASVSWALERVQGRERIILERHRFGGGTRDKRASVKSEAAPSRDGLNSQGGTGAPEGVTAAEPARPRRPFE